MESFLAFLTYFAYAFIILMYTIKIVKYLRMPVHLRWELYPVIHEEKFSYGGSYLENVDWRTKFVRKKRWFRAFFYLLKDYFTLSDYARRKFLYWLGLYPWHMGFILIITFHILCFLSAVFTLFGLDVSENSKSFFGRGFSHLVLTVGVGSFVLGLFGSVLISIRRLIDPDLRNFASPVNFLTYLFTFLVFLSGLLSWYVDDPKFAEYKDFWVGLLTLQFRDLKFFTKLHVFVFDLFLIYLPFTRSLHYITRFFAFFFIRWDDEPNIPGGDLEMKLKNQLRSKVSWGAPHIQTGRSWLEVAEWPPKS